MAAEALLITKRVEFFSIKEFARADLVNNHKSLCGLALKTKNILLSSQA